jgi:hypothetical protein
MGYYVRALPWKKSDPRWKLQFVSYKSQDTKDSNAIKAKKEWDVDADRWRSLGFHKFMTLDEAKVRARQLNAQDFIKRQEERIQRIAIEENNNKKRYDSVLPIEFVEEFEKRLLRTRDAETRKGRRKNSHARSKWKAAQKMIVALKIDPSEWYYYNKEVYDYFHEQQLSISYTISILSLVNAWGYFICRKLAKPFLPVTRPRGYERQRLLDAHYQRNKNRRKASGPLPPEVLNSASGKMNQANFNWLFISVWLGLRPQEIDNLHEQQLWRIETPIVGRKICWIYQTKIIALPPDDRWKPIPILYEEQEFALRIIQSGNFKRPLVKTMRQYFSKDIDLYGGRKGFTDLMLSKGNTIENISIWMGHSTLDRTWRSYKQKTKFHL